MDTDALALANILVGNAEDEAGLELVLTGGRFRAEGGPLRLALAGAAMPMAVGERKLAPLTSVTLQDGETLTIGSAASGVYAILAVAGGFDLPLELGSRSFHLRAGLGGFGGRLIRPGDRLPLRAVPLTGPDVTLTRSFSDDPGPVRVLMGPQDDYFAPDAIAIFLGSAYVVTPQADRMGYRLAGPKIPHASGFNIVSDGIGTGAIQVPGSGEPIVLLADRQTTGGYPKIATIISADLPKFVRFRPGDAVRFAAIDRKSAIAAARARRERLSAAKAALRPAGAIDLNSSRLLAENLIDGFIAGAEHD
jgi:biotin-dependent carboxylase-like uncharacterized protein